MKQLYKGTNFKGYNMKYINSIMMDFDCDINRDVELVKGNIMVTLDKYLKNEPGFRISLLHMVLY